MVPTRIHSKLTAKTYLKMEKLHKVQEKGGSAHIVLTGSNSVAANAIAAAAHASRKGGGGSCI